MNLTRISRILFGRSARLFALLTGLAYAFASPLAHAADAGSVTGSVSNTATGNLLEGARITVPALGLNALTDNSGRFVLADVPAGTHGSSSPTSASIPCARRSRFRRGSAPSATSI